MDVIFLGLTSTDQLYFVSGDRDIPGAMFTVSHNSVEYNGIKMCRSGARPVGQETGLADIVTNLVEKIPTYHGHPGELTEADTLADYAAFLRKLVP